MATKQKIDEKEHMNKYKEACDKMDAKITEKIDGEVYVFYSVYKTDEEDLPVDNLDEVAFEGKVAVICNWPSILSPKEILVSDILRDPTWLDLTVISNYFIEKTGDYHHRFFEGYHIVGETHSRVSLIEFHMGS